MMKRHVPLLVLLTVLLCSCSSEPQVSIPAPVPGVDSVSDRTAGVASAAMNAAGQDARAGAVALDGHWYKAFDEKISWHEARKKCLALGGHLAIVDTAQKQAFIAKLAAGRYLYLGATDELKEDDWRWVNGQPFKFTCWMDGQPNNYGGEEHYLATYDGGEWVDVANEGDGFWMPTGFICEWEQ